MFDKIGYIHVNSVVCGGTDATAQQLYFRIKFWFTVSRVSENKYLFPASRTFSGKVTVLQ